MSRKIYSHRKIRYWYSYDIEDICLSFQNEKLHFQTIRKWLKEGLKRVDQGKPILIYGNDLIEFLKERNSRGKCSTKFDQMYCMRCQDACCVLQNKVKPKQKKHMIQLCGICRTCKATMYKNYKLHDFSKIKETFRLVEVLELYDRETSIDRTQIGVTTKTTEKESTQGELFKC